MHEPDYTPEDVHVGMECLAPMKRPNNRSRTMERVRLTWVSTDGTVVEATTLGRGRRFEHPLAVCLLRRP